ncbi:MAG: transposase [Dehalococcoidia bacterium]
MQGQHQPQPKLFYHVTLEELVPQDDFYRILGRAVDLSFVRRRTADLYSYTGRPSVDPEVIIKLLLIAYLEGTTSERQLMRQVQVNLAYRRYIGYDLDEAIPDHSAISRNRSLFGKELFQELFDHVVKLCIQAGLVAGVHQSVDLTMVHANASMDSLVPREVATSPRGFVDQVFEENPVELGDAMVAVICLEEQQSDHSQPDPRQRVLEL